MTVQGDVVKILPGLQAISLLGANVKMFSPKMNNSDISYEGELKSYRKFLIVSTLVFVFLFF